MIQLTAEILSAVFLSLLRMVLVEITKTGLSEFFIKGFSAVLCYTDEWK